MGIFGCNKIQTQKGGMLLNRYLKSKVFAEKHRIKYATLKRWMKRGFPHVRLGSIILINESEGIKWLKSKTASDDAITFIQAARIANLSIHTLRSWRRKFPSFQRVIINDHFQTKISKKKLLEWLASNKPVITNESNYILMKDAARELNVSLATIQRWCDESGIDYFKVGTHERYQPFGNKALTFNAFNELKRMYRPLDSINTKRAAEIASVGIDKIHYWCKNHDDFPYDKETAIGKQIWISEREFSKWLEKHTVVDGIDKNQAAKIAGVDIQTLRKWANEYHDFPVQKDIRNELLDVISESEFLKWLKKRKK